MRTANAVMRGLRAASDACRTTAMHQMRATTASFEGAALYHCRSRAASGVAMPAVAMPATSLATRHGGVRGGFVTGGGVASRGAAERALPFALQTLRDISGCHVSAGKKDDGGDEKHADEKGAGILSDLLGNSKMVAVRDELETLAAERTHLRYEEFAGVVGGDAREAEKACRALVAAGVVVRLDDVVYLRPSELTREVLKVLPGVPSSVFGVTQAELAELEGELARMHAEVEAAKAAAAFRSNVVLGAGLVMLIAQLVVFIRLTYVELSWDVMEPLSYFVGVFNAILVYIYFMACQQDFSFQDWSVRMQNYFRRNKIQRAGIDYARYKSLLKTLRK